jgi:hypothetical protein
MNNTNTSITTQEFAKEFFLLLLDTHNYLKEQKKKATKTKTQTYEK